MALFKQKYRVESVRLRGWDYTTAGWYFVTVCAKNQECCFGDIVDEKMRLSAIGELVAEEWLKTEQVRPNIELDRWIIMPNHLHGILIIQHTIALGSVETPRRGVSTKTIPRLKSNSLGSIIGQFKSTCTKRIWQAGFRNFAWQPRFYDHIIRSPKSLKEIREYIVNNPLKWALDEYHL